MGWEAAGMRPLFGAFADALDFNLRVRCAYHILNKVPSTTMGMVQNAAVIVDRVASNPSKLAQNAA